jgi:glycosyltransferase involved in cell wall biosynthesis
VKISGFSFVKNGIMVDYPFLEAIQSVLPICDEFIVAVGDSTDKTREEIQDLKSDKIKIIDTVWDISKRTGGVVFAEQSNLALDGVTGDWVIHVQADEVIHEDEVFKLKAEILKYDEDPNVEGLILPYYHFWGDYNHIWTSRKAHRFEIRAFRNIKGIRSFRDSQGFRKYSSIEGYQNGEKGVKLKVKKSEAHIFHYKSVKPPKQMMQKMEIFHSFYHDDTWMKQKHSKETEWFDYQRYDRLEGFNKPQPGIMKDRISKKDWVFEYDKKKSKMKLKYRFLHAIEELTGYRLFEYKNYKII